MEPDHQFSYLDYGLTNVSNILREPGSSGSGVPLVYRAIEMEAAVGILPIAKVVHWTSDTRHTSSKLDLQASSSHL